MRISDWSSDVCSSDLALFRRLFLTRLRALHDRGQLALFGRLTHLAERRAFLRHLSPVRKKRWVVYAKPPFAGPEVVLAYLARYTHRVAISNSRLLRFDEAGAIGRAHVCTPVTNAHLVCRLLLSRKTIHATTI